MLVEVCNNAAPDIEYHLVLTSTPGGAFSMTPVDAGSEIELRDSEFLPAPMKMRRPYVTRKMRPLPLSKCGVPALML